MPIAGKLAVSGIGISPQSMEKVGPLVPAMPPELQK
jgi:hypothetical protein